MSDDDRHRSRTAWPGPMSVAGVDPGHDHELPAPLLQRVRLQGRAIVIFGVCLAAIATLLVLLILQRGEQRDRENAREEQRINDRFCEFLALAPDDHPLADEMRAELGCTQPGRAFEDYPPEVREELARRGGATPPSTPPTPRAAPPPPFMGGASPDAPVIVPEPPPTSEPTPPAPSPDPLVDLGPATELVCGTLPVCPEESR